jgi:hypothetical protein
MLSKFNTQKSTIDQFAFNPEQAIVFNSVRKYPTYLGIGMSLVYFVSLGILWFQGFYQMFTYANNSISADTTFIDLNDLGVKTMHEINAIPMYNLRYKGVHLPRNSDEICGGEFGGDCFAFASKYLDMYWIQANGYSNKTVDKTRLPSRPCEKDEVTKELWPNEYLFVCGPYK